MLCYARRAKAADLAHLHFHLYLPIHDAHGVAAGFHFRGIHPSSVTKSKTPGVPRARDDTVFYFAGSQRCTHMGTDVVQSVKLALFMKNGKELAINLDDPRFSFRNIARLPDGVKLRHFSASPCPQARLRA